MSGGSAARSRRGGCYCEGSHRLRCSERAAGADIAHHDANLSSLAFHNSSATAGISANAHFVLLSFGKNTTPRNYLGIFGDQVLCQECGIFCASAAGINHAVLEHVIRFVLLRCGLGALLLVARWEDGGLKEVVCSAKTFGLLQGHVARFACLDGSCARVCVVRLLAYTDHIVHVALRALLVIEAGGELARAAVTLGCHTGTASLPAILIATFLLAQDGVDRTVPAVVLQTGNAPIILRGAYLVDARQRRQKIAA